MSAPHMRRRYRAAGSKPGLTYVILLLLAAAVFVGQRVYSVRQQSTVDRLARDVHGLEVARDRLLARRDSLQTFAAIAPRARALGLNTPDLAQMARLPLEAPALYLEPSPATPAAITDAVGRIWRWLDPPAVSASEARAGE